MFKVINMQWAISILASFHLKSTLLDIRMVIPA